MAALESIKKTYAQIHFTFDSTAQSSAHKLPLQLPKNKVAFIKKVQYTLFDPTDAELAQNLAFCLLARSDAVPVILTSQAGQLQMMNRPDVISWNMSSFVETITQSAANIHRLESIIPEPGFPATNDLTCLFTGAKSQNTIALNMVCEVFYVDKNVTNKEWMMYAKRSLNAPRDLNVSQDPGGTWKGTSIPAN